MSNNPFNDYMLVVGKNLDNSYYSDMELLQEVFPDTSLVLLSDWERLYNISYPTLPPDPVRQANIMAAVRARGSMTKAYYEALGAAMGYTCVASESNLNLFIVASSHPPATLLPAPLYEMNEQFVWTYTITSPVAVPSLEKLITDLKPAHTVVVFDYN